MKLCITGADLERTDEELIDEFEQFLADKRANPPRRGKEPAEWHAAVRSAILASPKGTTPRKVAETLLTNGQAVDVSGGITDQKIKIGDIVVSWDTFQAYCYRFRKSQE